MSIKFLSLIDWHLGHKRQKRKLDKFMFQAIKWWCLILCVNLRGLKDAQRASKTLFLRLSVREEIRI